MTHVLIIVHERLDIDLSKCTLTKWIEIKYVHDSGVTRTWRLGGNEGARILLNISEIKRGQSLANFYKNA